jgi:hypothetical protein
MVDGYSWLGLGLMIVFFLNEILFSIKNIVTCRVVRGTNNCLVLVRMIGFVSTLVTIYLNYN